MPQTLNQFILYLKRTKKLSENTLQSYQHDIKLFADFLENTQYKDVKNATKSAVEEYITYLGTIGRVTSTIARSIVSLKSFYQYLLLCGIVKHDPTTEVHPPKVEKKLPQILSFKEVELLLEQPTANNLKGYRDKAMLELLYAV